MAYLDEIRIDQGSAPTRPEPILEEEKALREIMKREFEEMKKQRARAKT